jgi:hypothetical protein
MKSFKAFFSFLALATLLFVGASTASAQNGAFAPYTTIGITGSGTGSVLNSTTPSGNAGIGIESSTKHLLLDVNYNATFANGFSTGSGYTGKVTGSGYLKLGALLVGGGAYYSNQVTGFTTVKEVEEGVKTFFTGINVTQARPFVGVGLQFSHDRIIGNYILPGGFSITNINPPVADRSFNVTNEIFLGKSGLRKHIRLTQTLAFTSNLTGSTSSIVRATTWVGGGGLKFVL